MPKVTKVGLRVAYDGSLVIFKVMEGKSELDRKVFDYDLLPSEIQDQINLYGLNKILQDRTSDVSDKLEKLESMAEVFTMLEGGQFKKEREGGMPTVRVEVEALAQLKGVPVAVIQKSLKDYDQEQREKILGSEQVVKLAAEIKARRELEGTVSLDDLI